MRKRTTISLLFALCALVTHVRAQAAEKYAVAVFHFNIQYVAGGLVGFGFEPDPRLDLEAEVVEDMIVTESFAPIVDLFEKHPSWGVDLELQGYFLDVLAARHPAVLDKLRKLAKTGQIELVSFHYSDQLWIGFPEEDWEKSQALTRATFDKYDMPLGKSVFCQEGQAGEAMAKRMSALGYRNMIWPHNLWEYQHGDFAAAPLYSFGDGYLVVGGKGVAFVDGTNDITLDWTFMDDGELKATGGMNPYTPEAFKIHPEAVAAYESELSSLESQGYALVTVDQYVDKIKDHVTPQKPPPLFDGTWQPDSTTAVLRWLGGKGIWKGERDNEVRSLDALAHRELMAAETAAKSAGIEARADLDSAWRLLFLSEVTDATGINPFRGEVEYGIAHATEALRIARDVINRSKSALGEKSMLIDPQNDRVTPGKIADDLRGEAETSGPFELVIDAGDRSVETAWELIAPGHHRVEVRFGDGSAGPLSVTFPGTLDDALLSTRALADSELVTYKRSDFTFDSFHIALPLGLVSLGPSLFVVKDQARVHLAAKIRRDSGDIEFLDQTVEEFETPVWVFHVFEGDGASALDLARRINKTRTVVR